MDSGHRRVISNFFPNFWTKPCFTVWIGFLRGGGDSPKVPPIFPFPESSGFSRVPPPSPWTARDPKKNPIKFQLSTWFYVPNLFASPFHLSRPPGEVWSMPLVYRTSPQCTWSSLLRCHGYRVPPQCHVGTPRNAMPGFLMIRVYVNH